MKYLPLLLLIACTKEKQLTVITHRMYMWSMPASLHPTNSNPLCKDAFVKDSIWTETVNGSHPVLSDTLSPQALYIAGDNLVWGWPGKIISITKENY